MKLLAKLAGPCFLLRVFLPPFSKPHISGTIGPFFPEMMVVPLYPLHEINVDGPNFLPPLSSPLLFFFRWEIQAPLFPFFLLGIAKRKTPFPPSLCRWSIIFLRKTSFSSLLSFFPPFFFFFPLLADVRGRHFFFFPLRGFFSELISRS